MMDYATLVYEPIYDRLGVPAIISTAGGAELSVTVRNLTAGSTLSGVGGVDFQAFRPAAKVRMSELTGLAAFEDELPGGEILLDGKSWSIKSFEYDPSPNGISDGEVRLFLKDDLDV